MEKEKQSSAQCENKTDKTSVLFSYAVTLVQSGDRRQIRTGITLLEGIMETDRSHTKECVRHLGFAHASLGEYVLARKYVKLLLIDDAEDPKALALKDLLDKQILNDGMIGMGIVGAGLAATFLGLFYLWKFRIGK